MPVKRLIVAEDDYLVSREIKRMAEEVGYEVVAVVRNGVEAIAKTAELAPDAVIMDINMPEMDGLAAAARIRDDCAVPVIVLTAYETDDFVREASVNGVAAYLTKPVEGGLLDRSISIALARNDDLIRIRRLYKEAREREQKLEAAMAEIKTLRGLLPICSVCKKIRDEEDNWHQIEEYIARCTQAKFSHSYCPECYDKAKREIQDSRKFTDKQTVASAVDISRR